MLRRWHFGIKKKVYFSQNRESWHISDAQAERNKKNQGNFQTTVYNEEAGWVRWAKKTSRSKWRKELKLEVGGS